MNAHARLDRIAELSAEIEELRAKVRRLEDIAAPPPLRDFYGVRLTKMEGAIIALLRRRSMVARDQLMFALYQDADDSPNPKILDVHICKLRAKLPAGTTIETLHGGAWRLHVDAHIAEAAELSRDAEAARRTGVAEGMSRSRVLFEQALKAAFERLAEEETCLRSIGRGANQGGRDEASSR